MIEIVYDGIPQVCEHPILEDSLEFEKRVLSLHFDDRGKIVNGDRFKHLDHLDLPSKFTYLKTSNNKIAVIYLAENNIIVLGEICTRESDVKKFLKKASKIIQ